MMASKPLGAIFTPRRSIATGWLRKLKRIWRTIRSRFVLTPSNEPAAAQTHAAAAICQPLTVELAVSACLSLHSRFNSTCRGIVRFSFLRASSKHCLSSACGSISLLLVVASVVMNFHLRIGQVMAAVAGLSSRHRLVQNATVIDY